MITGFNGVIDLNLQSVIEIMKIYKIQNKKWVLQNVHKLFSKMTEIGKEKGQ